MECLPNILHKCNPNKTSWVVEFYTRFRLPVYVASCLLLIPFILLGLTSCTKMVQLKLKSAPGSLVIEGVVSNGPEGCYVKISRSAAFGDLSDFSLIENAQVVIRDSTRQLTDTLSIKMNSSGDKVYASRKIRAVCGHVYKLSVSLEGNEYESRSQLPDSVSLNGISLLSEAGKLTAESVFTAVPRFNDPKGKGNFYQFMQYINGKKDDGINVISDNIGDGLPNEQPIFTKKLDIHLGDTLTVVMLNISAPIYQFFYQLMQNADDFGVTPNNPQSNITGGALGYFSAQYRQEFTARIESSD